jgi:dihydrolipoamide dehydrogenase
VKNYDVVVIGAGPGGYPAAIRCAQLGLATACIDKWLDPEGAPVPGGTCLNAGCIPSKALLDTSHQYSFIKHEAQEHGIHSAGVTLDVHRMMTRKNRIVKTLTQGIGGLFRKYNVEWLPGEARMLSDRLIEVSPVGKEAGETYPVTTRHVIIATGSVPSAISVAQVDNRLIVDSSGALAFTDIPPRLGILGAGVIGLELGSVWGRLGSKVVILEALDRFLEPVDRKVAESAFRLLGAQGLDIRLGCRVTGTGSNNREVTINYENQQEKQQLTVDKLIVAAGRKPNTKGLGATDIGIEISEHGFIHVDDHCRTNLTNIYAVGDVVRGPMLAHKATAEGIMAAERIAGHKSNVNYSAIPGVVYTWPEIAWVGRTSQQLEAEAIDFRSGEFPFAASGRARASGSSDGQVRIFTDLKTDRILGVHVLGPHASELIAEAVTAMEFDGCGEDLAKIIHAHPTLSEALHEAALAAGGHSLHI